MQFPILLLYIDVLSDMDVLLDAFLILIVLKKVGKII